MYSPLDNKGQALAIFTAEKLLQLRETSHRLLNKVYGKYRRLSSNWWKNGAKRVIISKDIAN